uniref:Uncharacterized protein n=1 Tax=Acrobeloides nanus TaxID=290746 RepID=A0A914DR30_9BILA
MLTLRCCVDAREMAKIDSPKWQNNCGCDFDEMAEDSDCVDEVMPGTERYVLESTLVRRPPVKLLRSIRQGHGFTFYELF